ncbi:MAG: radical SAM protein [Coriobacteriales bacterium]|jgi:nitrogen fixation protein NifB|nr:radical SAM protein [Coriobacteriales bacterium]
MVVIREITRKTTETSARLDERACDSLPASGQRVAFAPTPSVPARSLENISAVHPCFALGKPNNKGRIHLPVSPACNIGCRFCERSINCGEQRPGVTAEVLKPDEALAILAQALELVPELSVVGIAGPGDTLATSAAFDTFRLVRKHFPQMLRCMSTNGLLLADKIDELVEVGIDTLTVTVNELDPERLALINDHIVYGGRLYTGVEAADLLVANQLAGIRAAAERGVLIKVNTVLIPSINGERIGEIARVVKEAGAGLYNIIPLIPHAKMADIPAPTCAQLDYARSKAEEHITVFRHCQHCRADAIGTIGGKDFGERLYLNRKRHENTFSHG